MTKMTRVSFLPPKAPGGACPAGGSTERAASVPLARPWPGSGGAPALVSEVLLQMWVLIPFCRFVLIHRELVFMMRCLLYNMTVCILPKYRGLLQRMSHLYP